MNLRSRVIRVAYENPDLRPILLPILREAAGPTSLQKIREAVNDACRFLGVEQDPTVVTGNVVTGGYITDLPPKDERMVRAEKERATRAILGEAGRDRPAIADIHVRVDRTFVAVTVTTK